ncbi:DUF1107 domain-containing protein [Thaumasiovibrio subtropicus]|uniref:DUF1107 domain-containing protein n=1 Tax=Thaumasiovibrio subtropicus TaxID=1891207 RepID=UPI000B362458|nr:DUF1107 domain-containing protein [Thaumasiovibrio subtropicus]
MLKVFHQYRPQQIARFVKSFHRGRFYVHGIGGFEFDLGKVMMPRHQQRPHLVAMAEINRAIKVLNEEYAA